MTREAAEDLATDLGYYELEQRTRPCTGCAQDAALSADAAGDCTWCGEAHGTGDETVVVGLREQTSAPWGIDEVVLGAGDPESALEDARWALLAERRKRDADARDDAMELRV